MNTERLEIVPTVAEENIQQSIGVFDISAGSGNDDGYQGTLFFQKKKSTIFEIWITLKNHPEHCNDMFQINFYSS